MRRAANVDANQPAIVRALKAAGYHVAHTYQLGRGFPDLVVTGYSIPLNAVAAVFVELKVGNDKLTEAEQAWHAAYPDGGPLIIARHENDVLAWFGRVTPAAIEGMTWD